MNLTNYVPVLLFIFAATGLGLLVVGIGFLFGPRKPDPAKLSPYECGFEVFEDARMRFDVRYYLITIFVYRKKGSCWSYWNTFWLTR